MLALKEPNIGTLRETFFCNQLGYQHQVEYSKQGDFLIDHHITFEIGGQAKEGKQVAAVENADLAIWIALLNTLRWHDKMSCQFFQSISIFQRSLSDRQAERCVQQSCVICPQVDVICTCGALYVAKPRWLFYVVAQRAGVISINS